MILYPNTLSLFTLAENWRSAIVVVTITMLAVYFLFALFDLWQKKREFAKKMRMSFRDIKDEYKKREGDPTIKSKRKKNMLELLKNIKGVARLDEADVIITNPTHIAVALKYRAKTMVYPKVLAKGKGFMAKWILAQARRHQLPVYRIPPLARAIYKESEVNEVIPLSEQQQIAEVYKLVLKLPNNKVFSK